MLRRPITSLIILGFVLVSSVNALHFYLDSNEKRCFIEELPTDTIVEGISFPGHDRPRFMYIFV